MATSLGGPETLVTHPASTTHVNLPPERAGGQRHRPGHDPGVGGARARRRRRRRLRAGARRRRLVSATPTAVPELIEVELYRQLAERTVGDQVARGRRARRLVRASGALARRTSSMPSWAAGSSARGATASGCCSTSTATVRALGLRFGMTGRLRRRRRGTDRAPRVRAGQGPAGVGPVRAAVRRRTEAAPDRIPGASAGSSSIPTCRASAPMPATITRRELTGGAGGSD